MKLRFLKLICKDFNDESALKTLYFSLVRSHFDYAALIWYTDNITQNQSLSSVQNNFLRYLSYKCHLDRVSHSEYDILCSFFKIMSLDKKLIY